MSDLTPPSPPGPRPGADTASGAQTSAQDSLVAQPAGHEDPGAASTVLILQALATVTAT